jgi:hypothetical protein
VNIQQSELLLPIISTGYDSINLPNGIDAAGGTMKIFRPMPNLITGADLLLNITELEENTIKKKKKIV